MRGRAMKVGELMQSLAGLDPNREVILDYDGNYANLASVVDIDRDVPHGLGFRNTDRVLLAAYCPLCEDGSTLDQRDCEHPSAAGRPERAEKKEPDRG